MRAYGSDRRAATLCQRGSGEIERAWMDLHFEAAITPLEIKWCGARSADENARSQGSGDRLHGGWFSAWRQFGVVGVLLVAFARRWRDVGGIGKRSTIGAVRAAFLEELVEGHAGRITG